MPPKFPVKDPHLSRRPHRFARMALCLWLALPLLAPFSARSESEAAAPRPNIILIFTDDQGYHDLGCFGSETIKTPHLDQMAEEGLRLTSFYAQPVCGVSRAALMTGSYPIRVGEPGNVKHLHTIPHPEEVTMAEVLKSAGYATALIGKWHLTEKKAGAPGGFDPDTMPNAQGFDYYFGTPLYNGATVRVEDSAFRSPLFRNQEVVVGAVESWDHITRDYTREALAWIDRQHATEQPFFLYLAHNLPHIPLGASEEFRGKSAYGPYGDAIEEIDWSCGEILKHLRELELDDNTLVIYTSDNGPWVETTKGMKPDGAAFIPRDHSGTADPLRGWKMSAWDGGCRVPCLVRWPGQVPAGRVSDEVLSTMDLLPTFAHLAGAALPEGRPLDGRDASAFLTGKTDASPRDEYLYYTGCLLTGVRSGPWKLVLPRPANPPGTGWWGRMIEAVPETQLFNLNEDPGETTNVAAQHPEAVASLMKRIERAREELGDIDRTGTGARFFEKGERKLQSPLKGASEKSPSLSAKPVAPKYDGAEPAGNLRFTFESGDLDGWTVTDGSLGQPISEAVSLPRWPGKPFNREGGHHLSTIDTGSGASDKQTGAVESPPFTIQGEKASFLVSGGYQEGKLYVALCDAATGEALLKAGGPSGPQMKRIDWDVSPWKDRNAFLRVVDESTGGWGHLCFDDFSIQGTLLASADGDAAEAKPKGPTAPKAAPPNKAPNTPKEAAPALGEVFGTQTSESGIRHSFLITGHATVIIGEDGRVLWQAPGRSRDGFVLENGNVLVSHGREAKEYTRDNPPQVVWSYTLSPENKELGTVLRLPNGNTLTVERGEKPRLLEIAPDGKTLAVEVPLQPDSDNAHLQTRMARKLPSGNYLVPHLLGFAIKEYQPDGTVVKTFRTDLPELGGREEENWPFTAIRLGNGNTLVNLTHGNKVVEFDADGKVVWRVDNADVDGRISDACGGQRLLNGNTVICSYGQKDPGKTKIFEIDRQKHVIWEYKNPQLSGIHEIHVLTTNGDPVPWPPLK